MLPITHYVKFRDPSNQARVWGVPSCFSPVKAGGAKVHRAAQDATVIINGIPLAIPEGADLSVVLRGAEVRVSPVIPSVERKQPVSVRSWPVHGGEGTQLEEAQETYEGRWIATGRTRPRIKSRRPSRVLAEGVFWRSGMGRGERGDRVPRPDLARNWTEKDARLPPWYLASLPYADRQEVVP